MTKITKKYIHNSAGHLPPLTPDMEIVIIDCCDFNHSIDDLPKNVHTLKFNINSKFNQPVDHLPVSLEVLHFGHKFNQPVEHLPESLKVLHFGGYFNQSVEHLPESLEVLHFGQKFNQSVKQLPESLKVLHFGWNFNQSVDHLPVNLHTLKFSYHFNQSVDHLPSNLRELYLGEHFNQSLDHLPANLHILKLGRYFNQSIDKIPPTIQTLVINGDGCDYDGDEYRGANINMGKLLQDWHYSKMKIVEGSNEELEKRIEILESKLAKTNDLLISQLDSSDCLQMFIKGEYDIVSNYFTLFHQGKDSAGEFVFKLLRKALDENLPDDAILWIINRWQDLITKDISCFLHLICSLRVRMIEQFYEKIPVEFNHYIYTVFDDGKTKHEYNILHQIFDLDKIDYLIWIVEKHEITKDELLEMYDQRCKCCKIDPIHRLLIDAFKHVAYLKKVYQIFPITTDMYTSYKWNHGYYNILHHHSGFYSGSNTESMLFIKDYHNLTSKQFAQMYFIGGNKKCAVTTNHHFHPNLIDEDHDKLEKLFGVKGVIESDDPCARLYEMNIV